MPEGRFVLAYLPCELPDGVHDLVVLSEVLYFLDGPGIASLACQIVQRWPDAEVLSVIWLGPSGNPLEGPESLTMFAAAMVPAFERCVVAQTGKYRIDRFNPS